MTIVLPEGSRKGPDSNLCQVPQALQTKGSRISAESHDKSSQTELKVLLRPTVSLSGYQVSGFHLGTATNFSPSFFNYF
jgi:hypothetical protein